MAESTRKPGRPRSARKTSAYQVRLPEELAAQFNAAVKEEAASASARGAKVSAASILAMLVARWLDERKRER